MSDILDVLKSTAAGRARMKELTNRKLESSFAAPSGSVICCEKCGERIRSTPYRWGSYQRLCGLCLDDLQNEDKKTFTQSPNDQAQR